MVLLLLEMLGLGMLSSRDAQLQGCSAPGMLGSGDAWLRGCWAPQQMQSRPGIAPVHAESGAGSSGSGDDVPGSYFRKPARLALVWCVN